VVPLGPDSRIAPILRNFFSNTVVLEQIEQDILQPPIIAKAIEKVLRQEWETRRVKLQAELAVLDEVLLSHFDSSWPSRTEGLSERLVATHGAASGANTADPAQAIAVAHPAVT
jgi:hypothetical protein